MRKIIRNQTYTYARDDLRFTWKLFNTYDSNFVEAVLTWNYNYIGTLVKMIKKLNFKQMKYLYFKGIMKNNHFKNKMKILTLLFVFFIPQLFYGQITFNCFSLAETTYQESEEGGIYFPV